MVTVMMPARVPERGAPRRGRPAGGSETDLESSGEMTRTAVAARIPETLSRKTMQSRKTMHLDSTVHDLERSILRTLAYSDVFDYPLTAAEVHRYLDGVAAAPAEVDDALRRMLRHNSLSGADGFIALPGREALFTTRLRRQREAESLWPAARRWAAIIGRLPLVRMVSLTGALAVDNVEPGADIDYLIVTVPGRVWLSRAMIVQVVRAARLAGVVLCPNWLLSSDALELEERSLFAARELAQMVPLTGADHYLRMRRLNAWTDDHLPNAAGPPGAAAATSPPHGRLARIAERMLMSRAGATIDHWDRRRKSREITLQHAESTEIVLDSRQCKGHVDGHGERIRSAYADRLAALGLGDGESAAPLAAS